MATENYYKDISHIVHISTDEGIRCEHCDFRIGTNNFAESVNHYINKHKYKLLHMGQETSQKDGNPFQLTVATLGK